MYLVTIVVAKRRRILSSIEVGEVHATPIGEVCDATWLEIPHHQPGAILRRVVIMPDHIHGLLEFAPGSRSTLPRAIGGFKSAVTRRVREADLWGVSPLWQRGYHDRILSHPGAIEAAKRYIESNPARWSC